MSQKKLPFIGSNHDSETRNIINEIIDVLNDLGYTYNESLQMARDILNEAKQTNDMNESVQQQINTLIAESGTSDAEVLQARVDSKGETHPVLKERIDQTEVAADRANENIAYLSIKDFPRLPGENEDSARINRMIDSIDGGVIQLFNGTYTTTEPIKLKDSIVIQGQNTFKTIIRNTNGTDIITTADENERFYYGQVNDLTLDGVEKGSQTGLNIPHMSYFISRNLCIQNVKRCTYLVGRRADGSVTGAYYNTFYNPVFTRGDEGFYFDAIANENIVYGGKIMQMNDGVIMRANSNKFFGTASEGIRDYHFKLYSFNNSFYSVRMEGFNTAVGILNDVTSSGYANYFYTPHFQDLLRMREDLSETLVIFDERGWKIPLRVHDIALQSHRQRNGDEPMVKMEDSSVGTSTTIYQSKKNTIVGNHFEALDRNGDLVAGITGYGEFDNRVPNRGLRLTSADGGRFILRVSNAGNLEIIKIN